MAQDPLPVPDRLVPEDDTAYYIEVTEGVNELLEQIKALITSAPLSALESLAHYVMDSNATQELRSHIEALMPAKTPRAALGELAHQIVTADSTEEEKDYREGFLLHRYGAIPTEIDGILRFFSEEQNLFDAFTRLVDSRRVLISLANELAKGQERNRCDWDAKHGEAASKICEVLKIPLVVMQPIHDEWGKRRDRELEEIGRESDDLQEGSEQVRLMRLGSVAWPYFETLLRVSINFYAEVFGYGEENAVTQAFDHARRQRALNKIMDAIRGIEKSFAPKEDETQDVGHARELCKWQFGRESPFQGFLDGEITMTSDELPLNWIEHAAKFDRRLEDSDLDDNITILRLNKYKTDIDYCRNFYKHKTEPVAKSVGPDKARYSFQTACDLISRLDTGLHLCPVLILPTEDGFDAYGRRVIRFVLGDDIKSDGIYKREKVRYLFARGNEEIALHSFHFCSYPARRGQFEPVIYPIQKILPA